MQVDLEIYIINFKTFNKHENWEFLDEHELNIVILCLHSLLDGDYYIYSPADY